MGIGDNLKADSEKLPIGVSDPNHNLNLQVGSAPTHSETLALGKQLMEIIDEHSALRVLLLWSNWRLSGRPQLHKPLIDPATWHLIMVMPTFHGT